MLCSLLASLFCLPVPMGDFTLENNYPTHTHEYPTQTFSEIPQKPEPITVPTVVLTEESIEDLILKTEIDICFTEFEEKLDLEPEETKDELVGQLIIGMIFAVGATGTDLNNVD